jgi:hypothetical protein
MAAPRRWTAVRRAGAHRISLHRDAVVEEITEHDVAYRTAEGPARAPADTVVVATDVSPGAALADELRTRDLEVHVVGDAASVGYIEGAVHSAWAVATRL